MIVIELPRRCGKSATRALGIEHAALAQLHQAGGEMPFLDLWKRLPCTQRELWRALHRQNSLGNIKRHTLREPIALTASARAAMDAARAFPVAQEGLAA